MIKQQVLHNFQAHTHSVLNYHPGVNVILGSGDVGKSSIRRGLTWVRANRPLGDGFIHDDADDCYVRLILKDPEGDTIIERGRDRKESNYYKLNGEPLTGFGANTPEVITQALAMEDINFQDQMTPYFLVVKSPGESAHYIRELMGLNVIDEAVSNLAGKIKRSNAIINSLECDQAENEQALASMEELQLDHFQVLLVQTQSYAKQEQDIVFSQSAVNAKLLEYDQIQVKLDAIPDNIEATIRLAEEQADEYQRRFLWHRSLQLPIDAYDDCVKQFAAVEVFMQKMDEAEAHIQMVTEFSEIIGMINPLVEKWDTTVRNKIDIGEVTTLISLAEQQADEYNTIQQKGRLVSQAYSEGFSKQTQLDILKETQNNYQVQIDSLTKQLIDCPTCGHKLTAEEKKQLLEGSKHE